ncbi:GATA zinc finger protein 3 [Gnomoniopsis sp. IMI 355080]|nr:GATA zinc finger protein 3 [Gnomoniopsis sp. IMI 355080]
MASMAAANSDQQTQQPTCMNCQTSTTPLWRRDEAGQVLCNACGLFLKLHGRPRPISLKTDVIKSRNRVKTMRPGMEVKKKNQAVASGATAADIQAQNAAAAALSASVRQKGNGHLDDTNSPVSRTATPHMYGNHMMYHGMDDHHLQQPLADFGVDANGNAHSPMNGDAIQTPNQLLAVNSGLKTRVDELEVINDLIQRRLQHYETYGTGGTNEEGLVVAANLRAQIESLQQSEAQLRSQLEESHRRENAMKRRLDEMEIELNALQSQDHDNGRAKRPRLDEEPVVNLEEEIRQEVQQTPTEVVPEVVPETVPEALEDVPAEAPAPEAQPEAQAEAPMTEADALKEALA